MAQRPAELHGPLFAPPVEERGKDSLRRCRGRPRLTDSDRAQRRLESRKKYDVRRVYLGESHKLWSELRRRTSLSDAGLAEYLILLNSTYGEKYRQECYGKKIGADVSLKQKGGSQQHVSSLQSLVCWYQEHSRSCTHEPQLRALEPQYNFSTAAIWQCDDNHSFVQYLVSPLREASDSEHEESAGGGDGDKEFASKTNVLVGEEAVSRKRGKEAHEHSRDLGEVDICDVQYNTVSTGDAESALRRQVTVEEPTKVAPLPGQPEWEMEMERQQSALTTAFHPLPNEEEEDEEEEAEDGGNIRAIHHDYVTVTVTDELVKADEDGVLSQGLSGAIPLAGPPPLEEQGELFDHQSLQAVVTDCNIPDQKAALEGSQLIIITGPSYEALASEGIQLNVGGGNVEEVTCTVIGGVAYNPACTPEPKLRTTEDEDSMTGLSDKQLLQPAVDHLELSNSRDLQRSLSSRSKRSRRGPVIEPDGMLKMFHCPYEGCSQVYVAISSFQNHVNLVHRKGRTKVCPHPGCGKKFYLSNHLHRHMIIHSGVRDFICETCGKSFKRKNHLEVHRRTHTGETPLQCEICGYQCRQRASLNWHMKKHTPEAHYNFTCEFCDKRFEKLDSVKFHKLKSHPDKQTT